jgi:maltose/moltooligosaccharide transporter
MPYAILAGAIPPAKTGIYMGIFNFSIVLPEIIASLVFGWVMAHVLNNNRLSAVVAGGAFMIVAAALLARVREHGADYADPMLVPARTVGPGSRHASEKVDLP